MGTHVHLEWINPALADVSAVPTLVALRQACGRGRAVRLPSTDRFDHLLCRIREESCGQWPTIPLSLEGFVCQLLARFPHLEAENALEHLLVDLCLSDLYLACACAQGIPAALTAFEQHYIAGIPSILAHMKLPAERVDEIRQLVRIRLLVRQGRAPKIAEYSGRGSLSNWVRVVTVNTAVSLLRTAGKVLDESDAILGGLPAPSLEPELEVFQRCYLHTFHQALEDALAALPGKYRYLLRLHFVERLSTTKIGARMSVNQSTASRWLQSAQQAVSKETQRLLKKRLNLSSQELTGVLSAVESHIDLNLSRVLAES